MPELETIFSKLKELILGIRSDDIVNNQKLDNIFDDIIKNKPLSSSNNYLDLVRWIFYKATKNLQIEEFFTYGATPASLGQGSRLFKYKLYETIIEYIPYCHRALNVITDNIIAPDDITKTSLEIIPLKVLGSHEEQQEEQNLKEFIKDTKIEESLSTIVSNTLLYGDFFVEISTIEKALIGRTFLTESMSIEQLSSLVRSKNIDYINESFEYIANGELNSKNLKILLDTTNFPLSHEKEYDPKQIQLVFHDPKFVVKLQSPLFGICFGYLVFPKVPYAPTSGLITPNNVDAICLSIIRKIQTKIGGDIDKLDIESDLKNILKSILNEFKEQDILRVRLVSPDRMVHFKKPSIKTFPYGESIFEPVQFPCRLLIAMETATTIQRLSRAVEKRVISVELGQAREVRNLIETIKETFRKRKISVDAMGSLDTIPSLISTFEDIYVPMKDGKKYVEFDTFTQGNVDVRSRIDDLKFIRDSIVAGLNVPPAFLGLEENIGAWTTTLTEQNILFTRSIISYQKFLSNQIKELLYKFAQMIMGDERTKILFEDFNITLPIPKSLQFEREARKVSEVVGTIQTLESLGIPRDYLIERFLPNIDLNEIKRHKIKQSIDQNITMAGSEPGTGGEFGIGGSPPIGTIPGPGGF